MDGTCTHNGWQIPKSPLEHRERGLRNLGCNIDWSVQQEQTVLPVSLSLEEEYFPYCYTGFDSDTFHTF